MVEFNPLLIQYDLHQRLFNNVFEGFSDEEIIKEWNSLYQPAREGLGKLTIEQMTSKPPEPFEEVSASIGQLWTFISHHQVYHIGQIGILRRAFGKAPLSYR